LKYTVLPPCFEPTDMSEGIHFSVGYTIRDEMLTTWKMMLF
jgi:hypothetical protein